MTEEEALQIGRKNCKLSAGEEIGIDVSNFHDYCALCEYACCNIIPGLFFMSFERTMGSRNNQ